RPYLLLFQEHPQYVQLNGMHLQEYGRIFRLISL
ncbi:hypothetical protein NT07LI_3480, partial [Listeria innocua FSL S4-378]